MVVVVVNAYIALHAPKIAIARHGHNNGHGHNKGGARTYPAPLSVDLISIS